MLKTLLLQLFLNYYETKQSKTEHAFTNWLNTPPEVTKWFYIFRKGSNMHSLDKDLIGSGYFISILIFFQWLSRNLRCILNFAFRNVCHVLYETLSMNVYVSNQLYVFLITLKR